MSRLRLLSSVAAGAIVAAAVSVAGGSAQPRPTAATVSTPVPAATARVHYARVAAVDPAVAAMRQRYRDEAGGPVAHKTLARVAADPGLRAAVRSHSTARVRAYVAGHFRSVWYHWHVSRLRISHGSTTLVETGVPFVVAGPATTLRDAHGHALARLQISIQDVIGYVRLNRRHNALETVVRGRGAGDVRTSLPAALRVHLPDGGHVRIAGRRYRVRSFSETGWRGEPLKIWLLS